MLGSASTCHWKPTSVRVQQTELASDGDLGLGKMAGRSRSSSWPCRLLTVSMHGSVCDKGCACRARGLLAELGHVADLEIGVEL